MILEITYLLPLHNGEFDVEMRASQPAFHVWCGTSCPNTTTLQQQARTATCSVFPAWRSAVEFILEKDHNVVFDVYVDDVPASQRS